ncbi:MAG: intradiol ring-cleavage dioxygenase [Bacteroidia bacterium]
MNRKGFLKAGMKSLGALVVIPVLASCEKEEIVGGSCEVSPTETAGPFPTKNPASLILTDITSDRTGLPMEIVITIQNRNNGCEPLAGAIVDIWHCDKDGYYSEYGGTSMQSADFTSVHFLRGRQTTNTEGQVGFNSIFPGWYSGRAPHIHVHIYDSDGNSLLVTQIAFPTDTCNTVYTTATQYYTKGTQDTSNSQDNVFSDSLDAEMSVVTGNISDGYKLTHTIVVNG